MPPLHLFPLHECPSTLGSPRRVEVKYSYDYASQCSCTMIGPMKMFLSLQCLSSSLCSYCNRLGKNSHLSLNPPPSSCCMPYLSIPGSLTAGVHVDYSTSITVAPADCFTWGHVPKIDFQIIQYTQYSSDVRFSFLLGIPMR